MRVILEPNRRSGRPLRMLLGYPLLRNTGHLEFLPPPQLTDQRALSLRIRDNRVPHPLVGALAADDQIPRIDGHDLVACAARMQCERNAAARAVVLTVAVARVLDILVAVFRIEWDEAQSVGEEFVGEYGGVLFYLDQVDRHRWDFGEDYSAKGVGEGKIDGTEFEIDTVWLGLEKPISGVLS